MKDLAKIPSVGHLKNKKRNNFQSATSQLISHDYSHRKAHQTKLDIDATSRSPRGRLSHTLALLGEAELSGTQWRCLLGSCSHHKVSLVHSVTRDEGPGQEQRRRGKNRMTHRLPVAVPTRVFWLRYFERPLEKHWWVGAVNLAKPCPHSFRHGL